MKTFICGKTAKLFSSVYTRTVKRPVDISMALLLLVLFNYGVYECCVKTRSTATTKWWMYSDVDEQETREKESLPEKSKLDEQIKKVDDENSDKKLILFDFPPFDEEIEYPINDKATCGRCEVSYDTSKRREADVVVHAFSGKRRLVVEARSFPGQIYVWMNQESPWTTLNYHQLTFDDNDDQFNLTMTYRRDSDIYMPYSTQHQLTEQIRQEKITLLGGFEAQVARKRGLAVWVSSNCGITKGATKRLQIILNLLEAGLEVDIFGECALRNQAGNWSTLPDQINGFKFYLSFENSFHCRDYITEKTWWNALRSGLVPVIWGPTRQDVEAVLPENSFLFVEDFDTPQTLVDRLRFFDDHVEEYLKFFAWRKKLDSRIFDRAPQTEMVGFCQLCRMLHDDDNYEKEHGVKPVRMVPSIYDWWYNRESNVCLMPISNSEVVLRKYQRITLLGELYFRSLTCRSYYMIVTAVMLVLILVCRVQQCSLMRARLLKLLDSRRWDV